MTKKEKPDEEVDLAQLAKMALEDIVNLSQSQIISEKLQSLNILLFVFILTLSITYYLGGPSTTGLSFLFIVGFSCVIALVVSHGYRRILFIVSNVSTNKIDSLRIAITILFIALTLGVAALVFDVELLVNLSLGLTALQMIIIPVSGSLLPRISVEDKKIELAQLWIALGRIASIVGIISSTINIILFLLKLS